MRGTVITQFDPAYSQARDALLFNGRKPAREPRIIVHARDAEDVCRAVRFAASAGLSVSPRGGGHNWSGIAQQGGMVIDLGQLDHIRIDTDTRLADVGPTATNRRMAGALAATGLGFPLGHCGSVPMSGYLLGGGIGWNASSWGVACFGIESLEVVLADGTLTRISADDTPELFWAAQGGGPLFPGIVVSYRLRLQEAPGTIRTAIWFYPIDAVEEVTTWMEACVADAPAGLEFTAKFCAAPPSLADKAQKLVCGIATVFAPDEADARAVHETIAAIAPAGALGAVPPMETPLEALYDIIDASYPRSRRFAVDAMWTDAAPVHLYRALAEGVLSAPNAECHAIGVIRSPLAPRPGDGAFSMIGESFGAAYALWEDEDEDEASLGWLRGISRAAQPVTKGVYVGEADLETAGRIRQAYSGSALTRLLAIRDAYDPEGLFRREIAGLAMAMPVADALA